MCPGPKLKTEDLLDRAAVHSKVPLCPKDVCRVVPPGYAALCQKVYLEQGLPEALVTSTMQILPPRPGAWGWSGEHTLTKASSPSFLRPGRGSATSTTEGTGPPSKGCDRN